MARTQSRVSKKKAPTRTKKLTNHASGGALTPKAQAALRRAEEALWSAGASPHRLLQELHESMLLRCLKEAGGNYAAAAALFGPSRQSVQQYANSPLRDARWKAYQQNRRKSAD